MKVRVPLESAEPLGSCSWPRCGPRLQQGESIALCRLCAAYASPRPLCPQLYAVRAEFFGTVLAALEAQPGSCQPERSCLFLHMSGAPFACCARCSLERLWHILEVDSQRFA